MKTEVEGVRSRNEKKTDRDQTLPPKNEENGRDKKRVLRRRQEENEGYIVGERKRKRKENDKSAEEYLQRIHEHKLKPAHQAVSTHPRTIYIPQDRP